MNAEEMAAVMPERVWWYVLIYTGVTFALILFLLFALYLVSVSVTRK